MLEPVLQAILQRLPATLVLGLVALTVGVPLGVLSAVKANSRADVVGTLFAMSGVAVPASGWASC